MIDWLPANIARDKLKQTTGKDPEVLIAWLSNGALRSHAAIWERDWRVAEEDVNLPTTFWLGTPVTEDGTPLDCFRSRDWESGFFRVLVNETGVARYVEGPPPYQHAAHFVKFSAEDLTRCMAKLRIGQSLRLTSLKPPLPDAMLVD